MGQYYTSCVIGLLDHNQHEVTTFDNHIGTTYVGLKLMEYSWCENDWLGAICRKIYNNTNSKGTPVSVRCFWVGDYAGQQEFTDLGISLDDYELVSSAMRQTSVKPITVTVADGNVLDGRFLVNLSKQIFVDCDAYLRENTYGGWCIHPLPLLTAVGNGLGGGDYYGTNKEAVGLWAGDEIAIVDAVEVPKDFQSVMYHFKES